MNLEENQKEYWNKVAAGKQFATPFHIELFPKLVGSLMGYYIYMIFY